MKPQFIFIAVFAVCLLMGIGLPQLANSAPQPVAAAPLPSAIAQTEFVPNTALEDSTAGLGAPGNEALPAVPQGEAAQEPAAQEPAAQTARVEPTLAPTLGAAPVLPTEAPVVDAAPVFADPEGLPTPTPLTAQSGAALPDLAAFTSSLGIGGAGGTGGADNDIVGVYVPGLFALPTIDQPPGNENYVSAQDGEITEYATPAWFGSVGLLAHNYLSGKAFFGLKQGQEFVLIYGSGRQARYRIDQIQHYQALSPTDPYSDFIDLADSSARMMSYRELFDRVYTTPGQVVFQTCLEANGDPSWGRIFVIANPL